MMTGPSNGLTPDNQGNGKAKNVNIDMQGVHSWISWKSSEEMVESERKNGWTSGCHDPCYNRRQQRGGEQAHDGQAYTSRLSSAVATLKKAKLPELVGARPKNTAQYSFRVQDIQCKDVTQPKEPLCS